MSKNESSIIIADPFDQYEDFTPEKLLRPSEPGILQLEMMSEVEFAHYMFNPDDKTNCFKKEFEVFEAFRNSVLRIIRGQYLSEGKLLTEADLTFEVNNLVDRSISIMTNFRLCNVDLREKRAVSLIDELRKARAFIAAKEKKLAST